MELGKDALCANKSLPGPRQSKSLLSATTLSSQPPTEGLAHHPSWYYLPVPTCSRLDHCNGQRAPHRGQWQVQTSLTHVLFVLRSPPRRHKLRSESSTFSQLPLNKPGHPADVNWGRTPASPPLPCMWRVPCSHETDQFTATATIHHHSCQAALLHDMCHPLIWPSRRPQEAGTIMFPTSQRVKLRTSDRVTTEIQKHSLWKWGISFSTLSGSCT